MGGLHGRPGGRPLHRRAPVARHGVAGVPDRRRGVGGPGLRDVLRARARHAASGWAGWARGCPRAGRGPRSATASSARAGGAATRPRGRRPPWTGPSTRSAGPRSSTASSPPTPPRSGSPSGSGRAGAAGAGCPSPWTPPVEIWGQTRERVAVAAAHAALTVALVTAAGRARPRRRPAAARRGPGAARHRPRGGRLGRPLGQLGRLRAGRGPLGLGLPAPPRRAAGLGGGDGRRDDPAEPAGHPGLEQRQALPRRAGPRRRPHRADGLRGARRGHGVARPPRRSW